MAAQLTLSTKSKAGENEILLRVLINRTTPVRLKTGIFIEPKYWLTKEKLQIIAARYQEEEQKRNSRRKTATTKDNGKSKSKEIPTEPCIDVDGLRGKLDSPYILKVVPASVKEKNERLQGLLNMIDIWVVDVRTNNKPADADALRQAVDKYLHPDKYKPKEEKPQTSTLLTAIRAYIEDSKTRITKSKTTVTPRTIMNLKQTERHITNFLSAKKHLPDIDIKLVDKSFYNDFINYLYDLGFTANTCGKHIKALKTILNALPMAQQIVCPILDKPRETPILAEDIANVALKEPELLRIADVELPSVTLDRVRDQFLMLAWTGCRYSDLDKLVKENIKTSSTGKQFFKMRQQKTGTEVYIPILPEVERILNKYDFNMPRPLSNQKFNSYLKDVCMAAGLTDIEKIERTRAGEKEIIRQPKYALISAHTARRSFATNMYERDMPSLMIMKITGHKSERAFLAYIKISEEDNAMKMLKKFEEQNGIKVNDKEDKA